MNPPPPEAGTLPPHVAFFLATSGHSGVDRVMTNLIHEFSRRGIRVDLLQIDNHGPYLDTVPTNVRLIKLGTAHVNTSLPPLVRYLKRARPQALLCDKDKVNRLALWARRLAGGSTRVAVRIGTTVSTNLRQRRPINRWSQKLSMRLFYRWADAVIVPSQGAAEDLSHITGLPAARIHAVPSPVITPQLSRLADEPVSHPWFDAPDIPVILGVGELSARKDFATLIRAFAKVRKARPVRLLILGEGRTRPALQALIDQLGLQEDVAMPGFSANPYPYFKNAAVFALSSICEGAPVVLMEALAIGTPACATDCPSGPREILDNGRYGALAPVGDDTALADGLLAMLDHPPAQSLLRHAAQRYTVGHSADHYLRALGLECSAT